MSNGQNFLVKLGQTHDEQMLKVSLRYLDSYLSYWQMTEILLLQMAHSWSLLVTMTISGPFVTTKFQSFANNSNMNQDILMKLSSFVHHRSALI